MKDILVKTYLYITVGDIQTQLHKVILVDGTDK